MGVSEIGTKNRNSQPSSNASSLQRCLDALAYTEWADKEAIENWKHRIGGETDEEYKYRQEGNAPGIVFSALPHEKQRRDLAHAPATPVAQVATSNVAGLVVTGNDNTESDNYVDDEGGEREDDKITGESSEVFP